MHIASPEVANILGRARFLARIRAALLEVLPENIAPHMQVAGYDDYHLRLHVSNAAWATRLRYMEANLRQALAQRMRLHIDRVEVKVRAVGLGPFGTAPQPRLMTAGTRAHIEMTARYIQDQPLANAMRRLAAAGRSE
ncbi:MAG: DUF721 domain-containing protein [Salinisphaera sp.]|nr:DUF721 domain-containing protein [Salinisphaera sp.]